MLGRHIRRYKVVKQLGDGTYGTVWKAINRQTNEVVSWGCRWASRHLGALAKPEGPLSRRAGQR